MNFSKFYKQKLCGFYCYTSKVNSKDVFVQGQHGYMTSTKDYFYVTITSKSKLLADSSFTDLTESEQTYRCTKDTLRPILEVIRPYANYEAVLKKQNERVRQLKCL